MEIFKAQISPFSVVITNYQNIYIFGKGKKKKEDEILKREKKNVFSCLVKKKVAQQNLAIFS